MRVGGDDLIGEQLRQLGDVRRDAPSLVGCQHLGHGSRLRCLARIHIRERLSRGVQNLAASGDSLSLKELLHLSFYPLGAGVFAGAAFALAASAVVQLLVAVGYISDRRQRLPRGATSWSPNRLFQLAPPVVRSHAASS